MVTFDRRLTQEEIQEAVDSGKYDVKRNEQGEVVELRSKQQLENVRGGQKFTGPSEVVTFDPAKQKATYERFTTVSRKSPGIEPVERRVYALGYQDRDNITDYELGEVKGSNINFVVSERYDPATQSVQYARSESDKQVKTTRNIGGTLTTSTRGKPTKEEVFDLKKRQEQFRKTGSYRLPGDPITIKLPGSGDVVKFNTPQEYLNFKRSFEKQQARNQQASQKLYEKAVEEQTKKNKQTLVLMSGDDSFSPNMSYATTFVPGQMSELKQQKAVEVSPPNKLLSFAQKKERASQKIEELERKGSVLNIPSIIKERGKESYYGARVGFEKFKDTINVSQPKKNAFIETSKETYDIARGAFETYTNPETPVVFGEGVKTSAFNLGKDLATKPITTSLDITAQVLTFEFGPRAIKSTYKFTKKTLGDILEISAIDTRISAPNFKDFFSVSDKAPNPSKAGRVGGSSAKQRSGSISKAELRKQTYNMQRNQVRDIASVPNAEFVTKGKKRLINIRDQENVVRAQISYKKGFDVAGYKVYEPITLPKGKVGGRVTEIGIIDKNKLPSQIENLQKNIDKNAYPKNFGSQSAKQSKQFTSGERERQALQYEQYLEVNQIKNQRQKLETVKKGEKKKKPNEFGQSFSQQQTNSLFNPLDSLSKKQKKELGINPPKQNIQTKGGRTREMQKLKERLKKMAEERKQVIKEQQKNKVETNNYPIPYNSQIPITPETTNNVVIIDIPTSGVRNKFTSRKSFGERIQSLPPKKDSSLTYSNIIDAEYRVLTEPSLLATSPTFGQSGIPKINTGFIVVPTTNSRIEQNNNLGISTPTNINIKTQNNIELDNLNFPVYDISVSPTQEQQPTQKQLVEQKTSPFVVSTPKIFPETTSISNVTIPTIDFTQPKKPKDEKPKPTQPKYPGFEIPQNIDIGKFIKPPIPKDSPQNQQKENNKNVFGVEVRRGGVFRRVRIYDDIQKAFGAGAGIVKNTAAASFRITGGKNTERFGASFLNPQIFRTSKKEPGVFVQKREKRISSVGEKGEITRKGLLFLQSNTKKRRKGFSLF